MAWLTTSTILNRLGTFEDESAWELLVSHFHEPVQRLAQGMGLSPPDAQDVAQETLLSFARRFREGDYDQGKGRLKGWLFGIARRQVLETQRRLSYRAGPSLDEAGFIDPAQENELDEKWEHEWRASIYLRALRQVESEVTPETAHIFRLVVTEQTPVAEVCDRLKVDRARVYDAKHRVARRLVTLVAEYQDA